MPTRRVGGCAGRGLTQAAAILGVDQCYLRDFGDGQLQNQPMESLITDVRGYLESERPDAVVTFPPDGISGHLDHRVIQRVAGEALRLTKRAIGLYHIVVPEADSQSQQYNNVNIHAIDVSNYRHQLLEALLAHRTQHRSVERVFPAVKTRDSNRFRSTEYYRAIHAIPGIPQHELL